jgi:hypothetical protein
MDPERKSDRKEDFVLEVEMKNAKVRSAVAVYRRIAKMVDGESAVKAEALGITKSERSVNQLLYIYFVDNVFPHLGHWIIEGVIAYYAALKAAKNAQLSEKQELNDRLESIKRNLPRLVQEFVDISINELRKPENEDLQFEFSSPSLTDPNREAMKIVVTKEDALVAGALPYPIAYASENFFKTEHQLTTGQLGYILELIKTKFGMQTASSYLESLKKERLEELTAKEAENLIEQLRNKVGG